MIYRQRTLPYKAMEFLAEKYSLSYRTCSLLEEQISGSYTDVHNKTHFLYRYKYNGGYAEEFVQAESKSNKSMIFLGLVIWDNDHHYLQEFRWEVEDIKMPIEKLWEAEPDTFKEISKAEFDSYARDMLFMSGPIVANPTKFMQEFGPYAPRWGFGILDSGQRVKAKV